MTLQQENGTEMYDCHRNLIAMISRKEDSIDRRISNKTEERVGAKFVKVVNSWHWEEGMWNRGPGDWAKNNVEGKKTRGISTFFFVISSGSSLALSLLSNWERFEEWEMLNSRSSLALHLISVNTICFPQCHFFHSVSSDSPVDWTLFRIIRFPPVSLCVADFRKSLDHSFLVFIFTFLALLSIDDVLFRRLPRLGWSLFNDRHRRSKRDEKN